MSQPSTVATFDAECLTQCIKMFLKPWPMAQVPTMAAALFFASWLTFAGHVVPFVLHFCLFPTALFNQWYNQAPSLWDGCLAWLAFSNTSTRQLSRLHSYHHLEHSLLDPKILELIDKHSETSIAKHSLKETLQPCYGHGKVRQHKSAWLFWQARKPWTPYAAIEWR